ncbi:hypothetical protein CUP1455 [Campylobacter upsaliensis RM3195]|nr:hypothetical protein CUP1455 [Campylobacter upsaliensis RM3195]
MSYHLAKAFYPYARARTTISPIKPPQKAPFVMRFFQ